MDKEELDSYIKAGKIVSESLRYGKNLIKPGASYVDVCDKVEEKIKALGGGIAFPAQISINNIAAHFCPLQDDTSVFKEGELVKLDIGVHIDGYIADTAISVNLGNHDNLIRASQEALQHALKMIEVGVALGEIGKTIQETISSYGFSPIKNLSGHGLGRFEVHTVPTIPNFDTGDETALEDDMVFAVEPFATTGQGMIFESSNPTVFSFSQKKPIRSQFARDLLRDIETYQGLPFTTRWLSRKHGIGKTNFGLRELSQAEIITEYPPLPERAGGIVSQAEHSVILHKGKKIVFTKQEE
ncbi:MAG: type II methionyl aminopeptidase [Nanoarchaeota archaeon]